MKLKLHWLANLQKIKVRRDFKRAALYCIVQSVV